MLRVWNTCLYFIPYLQASYQNYLYMCVKFRQDLSTQTYAYVIKNSEADNDILPWR